MKKIISLYKNGEKYQIGSLSAEELAQIRTDISTIDGDVNTLKTSKQDKLTAGSGIEITSSNVINVTLDTTLFEVVTELPESGVANRIYLVPMTDTEEKNMYAEYLYVNGAWEKIGEKQIQTDLSNYYNKGEIDGFLDAIEGEIAAVDNKVDQISTSQYLTQAEYDALTPKKPNVDYFIYVNDTSNDVTTQTLEDGNDGL